MATPTILDAMARGARRSFRAGVTVDGKEVGGRLFPLGGGAGRGIELVGNLSATYEELYRTQLWVQVVVNKLSRNIARLPWKVYVNPDEPGERERVRTGDLAELMARPGDRLGPGALKQAIVANVAIHGNCVLVPIYSRVGRAPIELIPTSFAYWDIKTDPEGNPWYIYSPGTGKTFAFRPEEVIHFRWWAAGAGRKADSPLAALVTTLKMEDATQRQTIASYENGARLRGAFSIEGTVKDKGVIDRMRAQLAEVYGGVDNAFKTAVLEGGAKWLPMQQTAVESELVNLRKLTREEVAAAYDIPPPVIGILDRATFSNITEQHLMLYQDTIQPWTSMIEETLAVQLVAPNPAMAGQYVEFEFGAVLAGDPVKQTATLVQAVGGPFMTPNEARARMNLSPLDGEQAETLRPPANASLQAEEVPDGDGGDS